MTQAQAAAARERIRAQREAAAALQGVEEAEAYMHDLRMRGGDWLAALRELQRRADGLWKAGEAFGRAVVAEAAAQSAPSVGADGADLRVG